MLNFWFAGPHFNFLSFLEKIVFLRGRFFALLLLTLIAAGTLHCIDRSNPWDPVNGCPEIIRLELFNTHKESIDTVVNKLRKEMAGLGSYESFVDTLRAHKSEVESHNEMVKIENKEVMSFNDSAEVQNVDAKAMGDLIYKRMLDTLWFYDYSVLPDEYDRIKGLLESEYEKVAFLIAEGNELCLPQGIYPRRYIDSMYSVIDSLELLADAHGSLREEREEFEQRNTGEVYPYNNDIRDLNLQVSRYNDSIAYVFRLRHRTPVRTSSEFLNSVTRAVPGDTIVVDTGVYSFSMRFTNSGTQNQPIVIIGSPFHRTILDSSDAIISNRSHIRLYGLVFQNSSVSGVKVEAHARSVYFENCMFAGNALFGMEVIESGVELKDCRIHHNRLSGIRIQGNLLVDYPFSADNILVAHNENYGINSISATLMVKNSTISDNAWDGVRLEVPNRSATFLRCLITYNGRYAIRRDSNSDRGLFITPYTVFFGNTDGVFHAEQTYIRDNEPYISIDPQYKSRNRNDFRVGSEEVLELGAGFRYPESVLTR